MNQPGSDQMVELFVRCEKSLSEVERTLDALTHKLNILMDQPIAQDHLGMYSLVR